MHTLLIVKPTTPLHIYLVDLNLMQKKNHDIMIDWVKFRVKYVFAGGMVGFHPTTLSTFLASSGP